MTSNYQDKYTMYHDKPAVNGEPSSNNAWIYTAYAKYLAPHDLIEPLVRNRFNGCVRSYKPLLIDRKPRKTDFPISKDEIIGMVSLGYLSNLELENNYYNFCNINREFDRKLTFKSFVKAVRALLKVRQEVAEKKLEGSDKRNYFWENEFVDAYPLAFKMLPWDIYYVRKMAGEKPSLFQRAMFYANAANVFARGDKSSRMILWLQLEDLGHFLRKLVPKKRWVRDYFGEEHPFYKGLK